MAGQLSETSLPAHAHCLSKRTGTAYSALPVYADGWGGEVCGAADSRWNDYSKPDRYDYRQEYGYWFRFVLPNQALVEMERNDLLLEIVLRDYTDYTGAVLEQYFRQKISEEDRVTRVGRYWDRKGLNEIDIIALNEIDKTALVAEVKRNAARYDSRLLEQKYQSIQSHFGGYKDVKLLGLSMADM